MMRPRRSRIMPLLARRAQRNEPVRLTSMTSSNSSSDIRMRSWSRVTPALATSTSTGPCAASISANAASTLAVSRTSPDDAEHAGRQVAGAVDGGDLVAVGHEPLGDRAADPAVGAGHEDAAGSGRVVGSLRHGTRRYPTSAPRHGTARAQVLGAALWDLHKAVDAGEPENGSGWRTGPAGHPARSGLPSGGEQQPPTARRPRGRGAQDHQRPGAARRRHVAAPEPLPDPDVGARRGLPARGVHLEPHPACGRR